MLRRTFSAIICALLLASILTLSFYVRTAKASGTIYIRADGSVDPPTAPIQRNGDLYTLTDNIIASAMYGIVVERNSIALNGAGYTLQGNGSWYGILLQGRSNVTIRNVVLAGFLYGIFLSNSSNNIIVQNNILNNVAGVQLIGSSCVYNTLTENIFTNNSNSSIILTGGSSYNVLQANKLYNNGGGIWSYTSSNYNNVTANNITATDWYAIKISSSSYNNITANNIKDNYQGIELQSSSLNFMTHNNFINNTVQAYVSPTLYNVWDDGYPRAGNYWSDYNGTDLYRGPFQNETGSDGIGDTSYVIGGNNTDRFPLMGQSGSATSTGEDVTVFPSPDVSLTFNNVTEAGSTTVNTTQTGPPLPQNRVLVGQYYDISTTADFSGNLTVRIIYDDRNLTQAQENSLQLMQWQPQLCDVTGPTAGIPDGIVNMRDIGYFASKFMTTPSSPNWDPRCDVTGPIPGVPDGIVNMRDIGEAVRNFMKTSYWANITTYVDTVSNVIYGEATHLSMFGVTRYG